MQPGVSIRGYHFKLTGATGLVSGSIGKEVNKTVKQVVTAAIELLAYPLRLWANGQLQWWCCTSLTHTS